MDRRALIRGRERRRARRWKRTPLPEGSECLTGPKRSTTDSLTLADELCHDLSTCLSCFRFQRSKKQCSLPAGERNGLCPALSRREPNARKSRTMLTRARVLTRACTPTCKHTHTHTRTHIHTYQGRLLNIPQPTC